MRTTLPPRARALIALVIATSASGVLAISASPASAATAEATVCFDGSLARTRTEIDSDITVPQFDPSLGTLLSVAVTGPSIHLDTDAAFESTAGSAVTFAERMDYLVTITSPGGLPSPTSVTGSIERVPMQPLAAFDGTLDYLGVSAVTQPATARDESASAVSSADAPVLSAFTGTGSLPFHLTTAISETFMGGGGNVQAQINTFASAVVQICYRYAPPAPPEVLPDVVEPPTAAPPAAPKLPATGAATLPMTVVGLVVLAVGTLLARHFRAPRPTLDA